MKQNVLVNEIECVHKFLLYLWTNLKIILYIFYKENSCNNQHFFQYDNANWNKLIQPYLT